jgi:hypothetical protein
MWTPGGFGRQSLVDTALTQLLITSPTPFPFSHDTPQLPAYPAVKVVKRRGRLAKPKIPMPSAQVDVKILNHPLQAHAPCASRDFPNSLLEANHRFRRYPPFLWFFRGETEAQEFPLPWPRHRTLLAVDLQLELCCDEARDALHHPLARPLTADVDVTVVRISYKAVAASLQFPVQLVQYDIA